MSVVGQAVALVIEVLVIAILAGVLLARITQWNICLYGHCFPVRRKEWEGWDCTFAIQNEEDAPLEEDLRFEVAVEEPGRGFVGDPELLCGTKSKLTGIWTVGDERAGEGRAVRSRYRFECKEFAALDTWVVKFRTDASPRRVRLEVRPVSKRWFPRVRARAILLSSKEAGVGPRRQPNWVTGVLAAALAVGVYVFPILNRDARWVLGGSYFSKPEWVLDGGMVMALVVGALVVFVLSGRTPPPIVQGYLGWAPQKRVRSESGGDTGVAPKAGSLKGESSGTPSAGA